MSTEHNFNNIRTLLNEGFTSEEFRHLCTDVEGFRPAHSELPWNSGKAEIVARLIEYANRTLRLDELLAWAKELNPARYEKHHPYHYGTVSSKIDQEALKTLLAQAEAHRTAGEWKEAVRGASEALKLDHRNAHALVIRAEAYLGLDRWDDAIRDATEALGIEPRNVRAWCVRAGAYLNLGDRLDDVIRDATEALGIEPENISALVMRAFAYNRCPKFEEAIRDASEALKIEHHNDENMTHLAIALSIRALAYYSLLRFDKAGQDAEKYLKLTIKPSTIFKVDRFESLQKSMLKISEVCRGGRGPKVDSTTNTAGHQGSSGALG